MNSLTNTKALRIILNTNKIFRKKNININTKLIELIKPILFKKDIISKDSCNPYTVNVQHIINNILTHIFENYNDSLLNVIKLIYTYLNLINSISTTSTLIKIINKTSLYEIKDVKNYLNEELKEGDLKQYYDNVMVFKKNNSSNDNAKAKAKTNAEAAARAKAKTNAEAQSNLQPNVATNLGTNKNIKITEEDLQKLSGRGIPNPGGFRCYANSTIQLLFSIPEIRISILNYNSTTVLNKTYINSLIINTYTENKQQEEKKQILILLSLKNIFQELNKDTVTFNNLNLNNNPINVTNIDYIIKLYIFYLNNISKNRKKDNFNTWQSGTEFLNYILSIIEKNMDKNIIQNLYYQTETIINCTDKKYSHYETIEAQKKYSVNFGTYDKKNGTDLQNYINIYQNSENVDNLKNCGNQKLSNNGDAVYGPGTKQTLIKPIPQNKYLLFLIEKGSQERNNEKSYQPISIIPNETITVDNKNYSLYGITLYGPYNSPNHYKYVRIKGNEKVFYNDGRVLTNDSWNINQTGLVYLYKLDEKKTQDNANAARAEALRKAQDNSSRAQAAAKVKAQAESSVNAAREEAIKKSKEEANTARAEALRKAQDNSARAQAEALRKAQAEAKAKAQTEAASKAKVQAEAAAKAKAQAEAAAKAKTQAETTAKAKVEAKEAAAKAKAKENTGKILKEMIEEGKKKTKAEAAARAQAEAAARAQANARAQAEAAAKAKLNAAINARNAYKILGISKNASSYDIKKAYKKLALKTHPNKGGDAEEFKKLGEAYETLSNIEKKNLYNRLGTKNYYRM